MRSGPCTEPAKGARRLGCSLGGIDGNNDAKAPTRSGQTGSRSEAAEPASRIGPELRGPGLRVCSRAVRSSILLSAACVAACLGFARDALAGEAQKLSPNVVLIVADDLGWNDVGYHGSEIRTPNIDQIASRGVELDRFYVYPTCSPTRSALLTGRSALRTGITRPITGFTEGGLPLDEKLLPEFFRDAGYQTFLVGKWHLGGSRAEYFPQNRGFDHFYGFLSGFVDYYDHSFIGGIDWQRNGRTLREEGYATDLITDEAVRLLRERDPERPTFLLVAYGAPHGPQAAPQQDVDRYAEIEDEDRRVYAAMVHRMDVGIGRILETLAKQELRDDTLVLFMSDNGGGGVGLASFVPHSSDGRNDPLRNGKASPYEGGIRVPAALWWPGVLDGGRKSAQVISVHDLLPTLAEASQIPVGDHKPLDGESRWSELRGGAPVARGPFAVNSVGTAAVIDGNWKLVKLPDLPILGFGAGSELYDLKEDPREEHDLASAHPRVVERLEAFLERFEAKPPLGGEFDLFAMLTHERDFSGGPITRMPHAEKGKLESVTVSGALRFDERDRDYEGSTGTIQYDADRSFGGYTLFSPTAARASYLIDMRGQVVHKWDLPHGMSVFKQVYLLPNGNLLRGIKPSERVMDKQGPGGTLQELDWNGALVWEYRSLDPNTRLREDYVRLPNGNTIFLAFEQVSREAAIGLGASAERIGAGVETLWPNKVVEIEPSGRTVWEWRFWDHYSSDRERNTRDPGRVDINLVEAPIAEINRDMSHSSTLDYDPVSDRVLISARITSEIYLIDHSTADADDPARGIAAARGPAGAILQRFGNPGNYGAGLPQRGSDPGDRLFFAQHGPGWIEADLPGAGHLLVHNNGVGRAGVEPGSFVGGALQILRRFLLSNTDDYATVDEIDPASGEVVWRFRAAHPQAISSFVMGGAQRLPNGNTHVTSGQHGHLFEVTPNGAVVWEYLSPVSSFGPQQHPLPYPLHNIQNSRRYAADHPALQGRALQPLGSVLDLEPSPTLGAVLAAAGLRALHNGLLVALGAVLVAWLLWRSLAALRRRRNRQGVAGPAL